VVALASVTVVGAGAVGSYYGALLARAGHRVTLVGRGAHGDALRERGRVTVRETDGTEWHAPVVAAARPEGPSPELVIVTTKSHHTDDAARALAPVVGPGTLVLSLQNGVENAGAIGARLGGPPALGGIAFVGVWVDRPGVVEHGAEGGVRIGDPLGGATPRARAAHAIVAAGWNVGLSDDIVLEQWRKLLWNVGFNAICAATGATVGEALAVPESAALVRGVMEEALAVANAAGIALTGADVEEMVAANAGLSDYRPSTARDLDTGRRSERSALSGFVVDEGASQGVPTPLNRALDALVALQEERSRRPGHGPGGAGR